MVPFNAAIYIIMGQNIGTCVTAMLSSMGAKKNAKTAALMHLLFNICLLYTSDYGKIQDGISARRRSMGSPCK